MKTATEAPPADSSDQMIRIPRAKFYLMLMGIVLVCGLVLILQQGPGNQLPHGQLSQAHRPPPPRDRWPWRAKHAPRDALPLGDDLGKKDHSQHGLSPEIKRRKKIQEEKRKGKIKRGEQRRRKKGEKGKRKENNEKQRKEREGKEKKKKKRKGNKEKGRKGSSGPSEQFQIPQPASSLTKHINTHLKNIKGVLPVINYQNDAKEIIKDKQNSDEDYVYDYNKNKQGHDEKNNDDDHDYNSNGGKEYNSDQAAKKEPVKDAGYEEYGEVDNESGSNVYNATPPSSSLLLYNRIPKCASSTMQTVLRRLSRKLNFEHISSSVFDARQLDQEEQQELVHNLTTMTNHHTLSFDRHIYYTNFTLFDAPSPVYVNMVRDPVERFISSFYYRRSSERVSRLQAKNVIQPPSDGWLNKTLEECVLHNDPECSFRSGDQKEMVLTYFCGHHPFCTEVGNAQAAAMARRTVKESYSVVGLIEHMEVSLQLLEALVPRFMAGATDVYDHIRMQENRIVNKNSDKPKVTKKVKRELRRRLADDIDFYDFLEQHLFQQKKVFIDL